MNNEENTNNSPQPQGKTGENKKGVDSSHEPQRATVSDVLVEIGKSVELLHDVDQNAYARIEQNGRFCLTSVKSKAFRDWLGNKYFEKMGRSCNKQQLDQEIDTIRARALYDSPQVEVYHRIAKVKDNWRDKFIDVVVIDLNNDANDAVFISPVGYWLDNPNEHGVNFIRSNASKALPSPVGQGDVNMLRDFINIGNDDNWKLVLTWIVSSIIPEKPYPILILQGEQGTAKTTTSEMLVSLIDPSKAGTRSCPKNEKELLISTKSRWLSAFDNLSGLSNEMADAFCRLSTGSAISVRSLYTDGDEYILEQARPTILNGIDNLTYRDDLMDRAIVIVPPVIKPENRREAGEVWEAFEKAVPVILGGLYEATAHVLAVRDSIRLSEMPRMARYAIIGTALEEHMGWPEGSFMKAYNDHQNHASRVTLQNDLVANALVDMLASKEGEFSGSATELYNDLVGRFGNDLKYMKGWPKNPRGLSSRLNRMKPSLVKCGMVIENRHTSTGSSLYINLGDWVLPDEEGMTFGKVGDCYDEDEWDDDSPY